MNKLLYTPPNSILAARFPGRAIPPEAVDSVAIELRNTAATPTTQKYRPAWLLTDGTIRDFSDTTANYATFDILEGDYYLVARHRDHLAIMTGAAQTITSAAPPAYDFTTGQTQAYGTNPMKLVGTKYCMYAGDGNASGIITAADANGVFVALNSTGHNPNDINLSGIVIAADANFVFGNLGKSSQVPGVTATAAASKSDRSPEESK
jgi:hypothetical protein